MHNGKGHEIKVENAARERGKKIRWEGGRLGIGAKGRLTPPHGKNLGVSITWEG